MNHVLLANTEEREYLIYLYGDIHNPVRHLYTDYYIVNIDEECFDTISLQEIVMEDPRQMLSISLEKFKDLIIEKRNERIDEIIK